MPRRRVQQPRTVTLRSVQRDHSNFKANFDSVYDQLKMSLENSNASSGTLIPLIMKCIGLVQKVARSSGDGGAAKKELVLALMTRIIEDSDLDESAKVTLQALLESIGPSIIDGLIAADHGKMIARGFARLREKCGCTAE